MHKLRRSLPLSLASVASVAAIGVLATPAVAPAASSVGVKLTEFKLTPTKTSAKAGKVTFSVTNAGKTEHELVVIRTTTKAADLSKNGKGKASEKGNVGEVELAAGASKTLTLNLKKGHYALICNVDMHYMAGMHADFTVR
jgi:uncharacterized cupredoxin-like copper-binding protein